jgi:hypothetical protein
MVMMPTAGNVVALSSGQENLEMRFGTEKYAKFAYASRYGFSVEADDRHFGNLAADNMLAFSDDGRHYRVRETNDFVRLAGDKLFARWRPWRDVTVETWLVPASPWHIRIHRITTPRPLATAEGGFAIPRADGSRDRLTAEPGRAEIAGPTDHAVIVDLTPGPRRDGRVQAALPNTNLVAARTWVPQLRGDIPAGTTILAAAILALPADAALPAAAAPPPLPDLAALEALFAEQATEVSAMLAPER